LKQQISSSGTVSGVFAFLAAAVSLVLWRTIVGTNMNILISAVIAIPLLTFIVLSFHDGGWQGIAELSRDWRTLTMMWTMLVMTHCIGSIISGDWTPKAMLASACLQMFGWWVHIHHWAEGLVAVGFAVRLIGHWHRFELAGQKSLSVIRGFGKRCLYGAAMMGVAAVLTSIWHWEDQQSLVFLYLGAAVYLVFLGVPCRVNEAGTEAFRICLAMALGTALGIVSSGIMEIIQDHSTLNKVPSTLIFFTDLPDARCLGQ
jgi:hypothetical protein